jgi:hypothetical protein
MFEYMTYPNTTIPYEAINNSTEGVAFSVHMSQIFVNEARKSKHIVTTPERYPSLWMYERRVNVRGFQQILIISAGE